MIVIGGGFTAVDCARTSRRLLGPDAGVSIMYRRGEGQMSANAEELREMREEGVRIETLVTPAGRQARTTASCRPSPSAATCWGRNATAASPPSGRFPAASSTFPAER